MRFFRFVYNMYIISIIKDAYKNIDVRSCEANTVGDRPIINLDTIPNASTDIVNTLLFVSLKIEYNEITIQAKIIK